MTTPERIALGAVLLGLFGATACVASQPSTDILAPSEDQIHLRSSQSRSLAAR